MPLGAAAAPTSASVRAERVGGQSRARLGQDRLVGVLGELDRLLLDGTVGQDHDHQPEPVAETDELHRPHGGRLVGGTDHHGGAVGQVGEQAGRALEHLLDLPVGVVEELPHLVSADRVE